MKKIEAVIRPEDLEAVKAAVADAGAHGLTVIEAKGHGAQRGVVTTVGGEEVVVDLLPKLYLTVVVHEHQVDAVVSSIVNACRSGNVGDGKIFVTPVEAALRVRTGETDADAL